MSHATNKRENYKKIKTLTDVNHVVRRHTEACHRRRRSLMLIIPILVVYMTSVSSFADVTSLCARQVMRSVEDAHALATSRQGQARAKYNFSGQTDIELSFRKVPLVITHCCTL